MKEEIKERKKKNSEQLWPITFRLNKEEKERMTRDKKLFRTNNNSAYIRALINTRGELKNEDFQRLENQFKTFDENYQKFNKELQRLQKNCNAEELKNELWKMIEEHKKKCKELASTIIEFKDEIMK